MIYEVASDLTYEIQSRIAGALRAEDWGAWSISVDRNGSGISASSYLDVCFETGDDDFTDAYAIRISDHEARSYNRCGDFAITLGRGDPNAQVWIDFDAVTEEVGREIEIFDVDDDDNAITRIETEIEEEFRGYEADEAAVSAAIDSAVAAVRRFFERETAEG